MMHFSDSTRKTESFDAPVFLAKYDEIKPAGKITKDGGKRQTLRLVL